MKIVMAILFLSVMTLTVFLNLGPQFVSSSHGEDKIAHFIFYAVLVMFFWKYMGGFSLAFVSVLATLLEYLQSFVPKRTSSPHDLLASLSGALAGYYLIKLFLRRRNP